MKQASSQYKEIMNRPMRNRGYISIGVGIVTQEAQAEAKAIGDFTDYSNDSNVFRNLKEHKEFATLEQNYWKADGSMYFMPRNHANAINTDITTNNQKIRVEFENAYNIKGFTIDFGSAYPTLLQIRTSASDEPYTFENDKQEFVTDTAFGDISWFEIEALTMVGGRQKMRIHKILCGVGLSFTNEEVENAQFNETLSIISEELPTKKFTVTIFDTDNVFNVEDDNSFVNFLETKQQVSCSFGLELDDGTIEWINKGYVYLSDWKSSKGKMQFSCTDIIGQMDDEYDKGDKIYERTAYDEAVSILDDMGFLPDEYDIDDYLHDVVLINPMPKGRHSECLQILANACRSIVYQDEDGKIVIKSNFARVITPEQINLTVSEQTEWAQPRNVFGNPSVEYVDLTFDSYVVNDTMYFLPDDNNYLEDTGYVSNNMSSENGYFDVNPYITFKLEESHTFQSMVLNFGANPPLEIIVHTKKNQEIVESIVFDELEKENLLFHSFKPFDTVTVEVVKALPFNRVLINQMSLGELTDYSLTKDGMMEQPVGFKEQSIKSVAVKQYSYNQKDDEYEEVKDDIWVTNTINSVGQNINVKNPLIHTQEHAQKVADWLGDYYLNNISYNVSYRGEPRIDTNDVIRLESDTIANLQTIVTESQLKYNGAWSGALELRKVSK